MAVPAVPALVAVLQDQLCCEGHGGHVSTVPVPCASQQGGESRAGCMALFSQHPWALRRQRVRVLGPQMSPALCCLIVIGLTGPPVADGRAAVIMGPSHPLGAE